MIDLIERGHELLAKGKVERAFACFSKMGKKSAIGYLELAHCYESGIGIEENLFMAQKYFWLAVRQAKRVHEKNIRALRNRPRNRMHGGRSEIYRYAKVRELLIAA